MHCPTVPRVLLASALVAALCGFTFVRNHITRAPIVDDTTPFYGAGLVLGPLEQLPGMAKRTPLKYRFYKFIQRKGSTQYVRGLRREADCSLSALYANLADYTIARTRSHFEQQLRRAAGLTGSAGGFPNGCIDIALGTAARNVAGARLPGGGYFGAGPDFHADTAIVVYRSDGATITDHHDISLAPDGSNQFVGELAVADFNGDGNLDYAVEIGAYGNDAVARIAFLAGDGAGGFGAPTYSIVAAAPTGSGKSAFPIGMTIADFDGDAKLDLAASVSIGGVEHSTVLLRGHGDDSFDAAVLVADGIGDDLVAADFNGDDKLDIASGDGYILFGNGSGGFTPAPEQTFDYGALAVADFDNDDKLDLAVREFSGDGSLIYIWQGDGSGGFTRLEPGYATGYGSGTSDLLATDLDGDGNADLVVGSGGDGIYGPSINSQGQTHFLLGRGDGTLASPPVYRKAVQTVADFDGDSRLDLVAFDAEGGAPGARVLPGDGHGRFGQGPFTALGFGTGPGSAPPIVAHDVNGDGKADLVALEHWSSSSAYVHTRLGNGDGTFHAAGQDLAVSFDVQSPYAGNAALPAIADFNGDGKPDLAVIGFASEHSTLYVLNGNGDGSFAEPATVDATLVSDGLAPSRVVASDLDGDGAPDLVVADGGAPFASPALPGGLRAYRNLGSGTFSPAPALAGPDYPDGIDVGDVDGDGVPDIVAAGTPGYDTMYIFKGRGDASFEAPRTSTLPDIWFRSIVIADVDGDGRNDLTLGNCCGLTFAWFARGDGAGNFATPRILPLAVSPTGLMLADLDGNAHPDLLVHGRGYLDDIRVYLNMWTDAIFASGFE